MPETSTLWLELDNCRLFAKRMGRMDPSRPTLIFLHDGLGSVASMRAFPLELSKATGLPAFAYDRRGHGHSDPIRRFDDDFMGSAADQLDEILNIAGIGDCILVGHSDGGTIALLHGARHHDRVSGIVTIAAHVERDSLTLEQIRRHGEMAASGDIPEWMIRFHGEKAPSLLRAWTEAWQRTFYDDWNIRGEIAAVSAPVLSIQGSEDAYGLPGQLFGIGETIAHARIEFIEGLGHFPHLEDATGMVALLSEFLQPYCEGRSPVL